MTFPDNPLGQVQADINGVLLTLEVVERLDTRAVIVTALQRCASDRTLGEALANWANHYGAWLV